MSGKIRRKLISLVGEKPMVVCKLEGEDCEALWDTGAMVSMVCREWLRTRYPDLLVTSIMDFLEGDELHLCTANNGKVAVEGVVIMSVEIGGSSVSVPFIVSADELAQPIIGFNVIKHFVKSGGNESSTLLRMSCPSLNEINARAVVNIINYEPAEDVAITTTQTVVPPNSRCRIKCKTGFKASAVNQSVLVAPVLLDTELELVDSVAVVHMGRQSMHIVVSNPTDEPIVLKKNIILGSVEPVSAVVPLMAGNSATRKGVSSLSVNTNNNDKAQQTSGGRQTQVPGVQKQAPRTEDHPHATEDWLPPVDLSHLSDEQRVIAENLLREEAGVFSRSKEDQGNVPDMEMTLHLKDDVPVVVPHRQIPRPLYEEVKHFINDLIVNN